MDRVTRKMRPANEVGLDNLARGDWFPVITIRSYLEPSRARDVTRRLLLSSALKRKAKVPNGMSQAASEYLTALRLSPVNV